MIRFKDGTPACETPHALQDRDVVSLKPVDCRGRDITVNAHSLHRFNELMN